MTVRRSELVKRVRAALHQDTRTRAAAIDVVDESGLVTLTGAVASDGVLQAAEEIARQVEGVVHVINALRIDSGDEEGAIAGTTPPAHDVHVPLRGIR